MLVLKMSVENRKTETGLGTIEIRLSDIRYNALPQICLPFLKKKTDEMLYGPMELSHAERKGEVLSAIMIKMLTGAISAVSAGEIEELIATMGQMQLDKVLNDMMEKNEIDFAFRNVEITHQ